MRITILSIGKTKSSACASLEDEYEKRINGRFQCTRQYLKNEKELQEACRSVKGKIVALEEKGKSLDSVAFANYLDAATKETNDLYFIIGDAVGISDEVKKTVQDTVSLSALTFPHEITRVIILEQIYRAQTIIAGHPYHK